MICFNKLKFWNLVNASQVHSFLQIGDKPLLILFVEFEFKSGEIISKNCFEKLSHLAVSAAMEPRFFRLISIDFRKA